MCNEQSKLQSIESNDTEPGRFLKKEDFDGSSVVDHTLVDRQSANPHETSLVEALKEKDVQYVKLKQKASGLSRDLQDSKQKLQNASARIDDLKSMAIETEKKLSASVENCDQLIIQVDNLRDELEDRDITIRIMAQSARRDQEWNAEISAHMEVLQSGQEQVEAENRTLRQQIQEEMWRNQILRNLLLMIARRPLRQGGPPLLIIQPLSLPVTEVIPDSLG